MSTTVPKAALYYNDKSIWATVALLALEEKGYGKEEVDLKLVDTSKGENFAPTFLRLNPKATVPTLVVPLENTLHADMDVRFKALTESVAIAEFLDKSRSALSRTQTTSAAPAPLLAPATIDFVAKSNAIIELLHSNEGDPNSLYFLCARNDAQLKASAKLVLDFLIPRRDALAGHLAETDKDEFHASEKTKTFWREKLAATEALIPIFEAAEKAEGDLSAEEKSKRAEYFERAKNAWEVNLKAVLLALSKEMVAPLVLGDQISIADLHLGPWLARVAFLSGVKAPDVGSVAIAKIEQQIGPDFSLPKEYQYTEAQRTPTAGAEVAPPNTSKLAAFWDAMKERPSWQKYYGTELH